MGKKKITLELEEYPDSSQLPDADRRLLTEARAALDLAYAPYSGFRVGVAALTASGAVVRGGNLENAAYPMCLCGERSALAAAASQYPEDPVVAMAITVKHRAKTIAEPAGPCGACRQVLAEFGGDMVVVLPGKNGPTLRPLDSLLPSGFGPADLPPPGGAPPPKE